MEKYVFVGTRAPVLKEMLCMGLNLKKVWVVENSFLHKILKVDAFVEDYELIQNKKQLVEKMEETEFDILIAGGLEYILPINKLKKAKYINIHPSYLPDLKGKNPVNAAFLYERDCGASCHLMDDGIDTGSIISRIHIPMTNDIDAAILYQLCFKAEAMVFKKAYEVNFEPLKIQPQLDDAIYFTMKSSDMYIQFDKGFDYIIRQVKAFGCITKGLYFKCNNSIFHFFRASEITNSFVVEYCRYLKNLCVGLVFENSIVFKFEDRIMRFDAIEELDGKIREGDFLYSVYEIE